MRKGSGIPTPFLTGHRTWHYDAAGNLLDGPPPFGGAPTTYSYTYPSPSAPVTPANWLPNELVLKRYQNSGFSSSTNEYAYDDGGNTTTISQTTTASSNGQTAVLTHTIRLDYDAAGRVTSVSYDDGRHASLGYNARGAARPLCHALPGWQHRERAATLSRQPGRPGRGHQHAARGPAVHLH